MTRRRATVVAALGLSWMLVVIAGFGFLTNYSLIAAPSEVSTKRVSIPATSIPSSNRAELLLLAHPKCPCTVATVNELARTIPRARSPLHIRIALYLPESKSESWAKAAVWRAAAQIPGVEFQLDHEGELARALGAHTSGHAFLFDQEGRLLFNGGLTSARGHEGASAGTSAILSWVNENHGPPETPVFGCSIFGDEPSSAKDRS